RADFLQATTALYKTASRTSALRLVEADAASSRLFEYKNLIPVKSPDTVSKWFKNGVRRWLAWNFLSPTFDRGSISGSDLSVDMDSGAAFRCSEEGGSSTALSARACESGLTEMYLNSTERKAVASVAPTVFVRSPEAQFLFDSERYLTKFYRKRSRVLRRSAYPITTNVRTKRNMLAAVCVGLHESFFEVVQQMEPIGHSATLTEITKIATLQQRYKNLLDGLSALRIVEAMRLHLASSTQIDTLSKAQNEPEFSVGRTVSDRVDHVDLSVDMVQEGIQNAQKKRWFIATDFLHVFSFRSLVLRLGDLADSKATKWGYIKRDSLVVHRSADPTGQSTEEAVAKVLADPTFILIASADTFELQRDDGSRMQKMYALNWATHTWPRCSSPPTRRVYIRISGDNEVRFMNNSYLHQLAVKRRYAIVDANRTIGSICNSDNEDTAPRNLG
uniref:OB_NTP_bind domain-containing protein n=1 Tax=Macrostomum lignano TaxID=282301 RepID=A0A1I8FCD9_9PLAT